jgi:hypothetical protein
MNEYSYNCCVTTDYKLKKSKLGSPPLTLGAYVFKERKKEKEKKTIKCFNSHMKTQSH